MKLVTDKKVLIVFVIIVALLLIVGGYFFLRGSYQTPRPGPVIPALPNVIP